MSLILHRNAANWLPTFSDRLFEDFFTPIERAVQAADYSYFHAPVDIEETEKTIELRMDLPGVKREEVQIALENGILTISGERKRETVADSKTCFLCERSSGSFKRSFTLGDRINPDGIQAKLVEGILEVTLPKKDEVLPKQIAIK